MLPSRISSGAFVLKLLRIITNLLSKLRADVGTLMSVPLLLATRGVPDECRKRPRPLGMEIIRFPVSSRIGHVFGPLLFMGGTTYLLVFVNVVGLPFPFVAVWYLGRRVRVLVLLNFAYCLFLKYSKAPDPRWGSRGMAMAAPPCCLALAWLHGEYSALSARSVSL